MDVPSFAFLGFAAAVACIINISTNGRWRSAVLALANVGFVLTFTRDVRALAPFAGLLAFGYATMWLAQTHRRATPIAAVVAAIVLVFCWLKRYSFIPHAAYLPFDYLSIGLSYVFFRVLHLVIDAYSGTLKERVGPVAYVSYTLNFTSFVSGPIQLFPDYRKTEALAPARLHLDDAGRALERIITGLFKVVIVSPVLLDIDDRGLHAVAAGAALGTLVAGAVVAVGTFPVYLYVNFSGYTDFVIGTARFLRLELPENFDRPFRSVSFLDFWSRWHMTLSGWLKRYVYTTVALRAMRRFPDQRVEPYIGVGAYFITFFLVGLWHGQTSMFVVYGLLQGAGMSTNKLYSILMTQRLGKKRYKAVCAGPLYAAASRGLTFTYFAGTLLWFALSATALQSFADSLGPLGCVATLVAVFVIATAVLAVPGRAGAPAVASFYLRTAWSTVMLLCVLSISTVLSAPAPHVVYKAF